MPSFAHIGDCHIGAWRDLRLREINIRSFEDTIDDIIKRQVDFTIISGDLFHVNLPDLASVKRVVSKLNEAKDRGITTYVVYGSHDYSPNATAMIDVLAAGGLLVRVMDARIEDEKVKLNCIVDEKTQAKLCGISGRSYTLERDYYELLDREALEKEDGFRIFVMHSALNEVKPLSAVYDQGIPISYLPQGFEYYAGGHIHEYIHDHLDDYGEIVYPGALFGSNFADLEIVAKGGKRGYTIVEFDKAVKSIEFIENDIAPIEYHQISGENKSSEEVSNKLYKLVEEIDPKNKIILIKIVGTLSHGLPTDI
ncbi:MAG: metallophosphoesterase family protein, partial [Promethearchaeota archaeon]